MLNPKERIRMLEKEIERFKRKYGIYFDATEDLRKFEQLMKNGFDPDEILKDVSEWEDLEEELRELKGKE